MRCNLRTVGILFRLFHLQFQFLLMTKIFQTKHHWQRNMNDLLKCSDKVLKIIQNEKNKTTSTFLQRSLRYVIWRNNNNVLVVFRVTRTLNFFFFRDWHYPEVLACIFDRYCKNVSKTKSLQTNISCLLRLSKTTILTLNKISILKVSIWYWYRYPAPTVRTDFKPL